MQVVLTLQFSGDGLTQEGVAGDGRVLRVVLVDGDLGLLLDMVGGVEVRFADAHIDDVDTLSLHLRALL